MASGENKLIDGNVTENCKDATNGTENKVDKDNNEDLDDLLDSALDDFDKYSNLNKDTSKTGSQNGAENTSNSNAKAATSDSFQESTFNQIYEEMLKQLQGDASNANSSAAAADYLGDPLVAGDVAETLQKALGSLNQNLKDLQNENMSESEMIDLLSKMSSAGLDDSDVSNAGDDIFPMMKNMMKNLLSKELLYPSLQTISQQYPSWLLTNEKKLSSDDYKRYKEQYRIMSEIVTEYEAEKNEDSDEVKSLRMNKVLDMMQQMQSLGNPPQEIIGDMPKDLEYDELGFPKIPGLIPDPNQCTIS